MKAITRVLLSMTLIVMAIAMTACGQATASHLAEKMNSVCPVTVENGITMQSVTSEGNGIVFLFVANLGNEISLAEALGTSEVKSVTVESIKAKALNDEDTSNLLDVCTTMGVNIIYRYKNTSTNETYDIVITSDDLK